MLSILPEPLDVIYIAVDVQHGGSKDADEEPLKSGLPVTGPQPRISSNTTEKPPRSAYRPPLDESRVGGDPKHMGVKSIWKGLKRYFCDNVFHGISHSSC